MATSLNLNLPPLIRIRRRFLLNRLDKIIMNDKFKPYNPKDVGKKYKQGRAVLIPINCQIKKIEKKGKIYHYVASAELPVLCIWHALNATIQDILIRKRMNIKLMASGTTRRHCTQNVVRKITKRRNFAPRSR